MHAACVNRQDQILTLTLPKARPGNLTLTSQPELFYGSGGPCRKRPRFGFLRMVILLTFTILDVNIFNQFEAKKYLELSFILALGVYNLKPKCQPTKFSDSYTHRLIIK